MGQELMECNRRLSELREEVALFLSQASEDYVYWVERSGKTQKNVALNAAPVDVAAFLRAHLFGADTSIIMTSATLSISGMPAPASPTKPSPADRPRVLPSRKPGPDLSGLNYFAYRVGAESARLLQVGTPFDYEKQMKFCVVRKMPDPREEG